MTKNQRNHRNTRPVKVSNAKTARPISHQKQPSTTEIQQQTSNVKESNLIQKQQKTIEELLDRLGRVEATVSAMEGELAVVRNVNTILSQQLDEADQYSRRSCMIVTASESPEKMRRTTKTANGLSRQSQVKPGWTKENSRSTWTRSIL